MTLIGTHDLVPRSFGQIQGDLLKNCIMCVHSITIKKHWKLILHTKFVFDLRVMLFMQGHFGKFKDIFERTTNYFKMGCSLKCVV